MWPALNSSADVGKIKWQRTSTICWDLFTPWEASKMVATSYRRAFCLRSKLNAFLISFARTSDVFLLVSAVCWKMIQAPFAHSCFSHFISLDVGDGDGEGGVWVRGGHERWAESWSDGGGPRPWISDQHHRILGSHASLIIWGIVYSPSIIKTNHRPAACSRPVVITQQLLSPHFQVTRSLSRSLFWLLIRFTFFFLFFLLIRCTL